MQHIMCNTKNTYLLLKDFTNEELLMRLVLMRFRCCATHPLKNWGWTKFWFDSFWAFKKV